MMFCFYGYLCRKNRNGREEEWKMRRVIWDLKEGKGFGNVGDLVGKKVIEVYGKERNNIMFGCVGG